MISKAESKVNERIVTQQMGKARTVGLIKPCNGIAREAGSKPYLNLSCLPLVAGGAAAKSSTPACDPNVEVDAWTSWITARSPIGSVWADKWVSWIELDKGNMLLELGNS